jgi:hypothetical protein
MWVRDWLTPSHGARNLRRDADATRGGKLRICANLAQRPRPR